MCVQISVINKITTSGRDGRRRILTCGLRYFVLMLDESVSVCLCALKCDDILVCMMTRLL